MSLTRNPKPGWRRKPNPEQRGTWCYERGDFRIYPAHSIGGGLRPYWWYAYRISNKESVTNARILHDCKVLVDRWEEVQP